MENGLQGTPAEGGRLRKKGMARFEKTQRPPSETVPHSAHQDPPAIGKGLGLALPGAFRGVCLAVQGEELKLLAGVGLRP